MEVDLQLQISSQNFHSDEIIEELPTESMLNFSIMVHEHLTYQTVHALQVLPSTVPMFLFHLQINFFSPPNTMFRDLILLMEFTYRFDILQSSFNGVTPEKG